MLEREIVSLSKQLLHNLYLISKNQKDDKTMVLIEKKKDRDRKYRNIRKNKTLRKKQ
jgi:hypothetical protein